MGAKTEEAPVLVPVDFSKYSEAALLYACRLARCTKAPVRVLHVVHDPADMPGYYSQAFKKKRLGRIEDVAREMLDGFLAGVAASHPNVKALQDLEPLLVLGLPTTRILEVAEKMKASAIVMGSKGSTGLKHLMLGSVSEHVVRLSPIPVTVVKAVKG
ncbi:MAG: universal stress protein [Chromatiales bacterium]|jgi:nucleotide-binding universal stress UspA family protein